MKAILRLILLTAAAIGTTVVARAGEDEARDSIKQAIQSYVAAFNAHDAQKLADHWSPEGVYISRLSGDRVIGREALQQEFAALFEEEKETKLAVATDSIEFISPNVALERGSAVVARPDEPPENSTYRVVYVRTEGKWLVDRVTDEEVPVVRSQYEHLKDLEWMTGEWVDQDGDVAIKTECKWTRNKNFLTRSFTVSMDDDVEMAGMQLIGWDPVEKKIRSWVFDSDGGFAEGELRRSGKRWSLHSTATMPDGRRGSSTSIFRPIDANSFGWTKVTRVVDGELLPNLGEVIIVRADSKK